MPKIEDAIAILESLKRTEHYECDDSYYSCPKLGRTAGRYDGIPISERPCDCGMDELNAGLESAIAILRSVQQAPSAQRKESFASMQQALDSMRDVVNLMEKQLQERPTQATHISRDRGGNIPSLVGKRKRLFIQFGKQAPQDLRKLMDEFWRQKKGRNSNPPASQSPSPQAEPSHDRV